MNTDSDIDLLQLMAKWYLFLKKKILIILLFLVIGTIYGVMNFLNNPVKFKPFFSKDYVVESAFVPNDILYDIVNNYKTKIDEFTAGGEYSLAYLGVTQATIEKCKSINVRLKSNINSDVSRVLLNIEAFDIANIDSVLKGIDVAVNNNEFLKSRYALMQKQDQQMLAIINLQIGQLNSAKANADAQEVKGTSDHVSFVELMEKRQKVEKELASKAVDFIETNSGAVTGIPKSSKLSILNYAFVGTIVGVVIAYLLNLFSKIKAVAKSNTKD